MEDFLGVTDKERIGGFMKRSDIQELEGLTNWISDASARLSGSFPDNEDEVLEALDELETMCGLVLEKIEAVRDDR